MKTIEEIRLENLRSLISKLGGPEIFSGKIGKTPNQVSQLANGHKGIGSKIAREVEAAINLERGWIDNDHSRDGAQAPLIEEKIYEAIRNDEALSILAKLSRAIERTSADLSAALLALQARSSSEVITGTPDEMHNRLTPKDKERTNMVDGHLNFRNLKYAAKMTVKPKTVETLAINLKMLMKAYGVSKKELAIKSGISERMIGYILAGEKTATIQSTDDLARAFGLDGWQLIIPNLKTDPAKKRTASEPMDPAVHRQNP